MSKLTKPGVLGLLALCVIAVSTIASANGPRRHHHGHGHHGHGHHGHHSHFGLGFVFGGPLWYPAPVYPMYRPYYSVPAPVYIERDDVAVVPREPGGPFWYYCRESDLYYPYVKQCPGSWERVPAQPASR